MRLQKSYDPIMHRIRYSSKNKIKKRKAYPRKVQSQFKELETRAVRVYPDNDDLYRVILSPLAYACAEEVTSNSTSLFYNELFIPNAFSPNGDGVNDYWEILGLQDYPSHRLEIYNRLGIKLYETTNYKNDWNR